MQLRSPFLDVIVRRFSVPGSRRPTRRWVSVSGDPHPAPFRQVAQKTARAHPTPARPEAWPHEDCANEPSLLHGFGEARTVWTLGAKVALALLLLVTASAPAAVREVGAIGITVGDLDRVLPFYTNTLPFQLKGVTTASGRDLDELLGLRGARTRSAELQLGTERLILTEHLANKGRPIPPDSRSFDHWFQHIAIVVSDMDRAYAQLLRHKVRHVSTAPQTLPAWNPDAGGIKAFYFRDPEDHVLEIIWFPPGKGDPKWQRLKEDSGAPLFLGIDHTAIVVSDTDRSLAFYTNALGLRVVGGAHNHGTEQEHLNQVFGARLRITALRAEQGPGVELLEYIAPPGGRPLPEDARANDLLFWHTRMRLDAPAPIAEELRRQGVRFVSRAGARFPLVRDPDGHALWLQGIPAAGPSAE